MSGRSEECGAERPRHGACGIPNSRRGPGRVDGTPARRVRRHPQSIKVLNLNDREENERDDERLRGGTCDPNAGDAGGRRYLQSTNGFQHGEECILPAARAVATRWRWLRMGACRKARACAGSTEREWTHAGLPGQLADRARLSACGLHHAHSASLGSSRAQEDTGRVKMSSRGGWQDTMRMTVAWGRAAGGRAAGSQSRRCDAMRLVRSVAGERKG